MTEKGDEIAKIIRKIQKMKGDLEELEKKLARFAESTKTRKPP